MGRWRATQVWPWIRSDTVTSLNRTPQGSPAMETKLPVESSNAERSPIRESPCMVPASGQHGFELTGNPTMPQSGLQCPRPSAVVTNKATAVHCRQQTPFCPPKKQVKSPGAALTRMTACCYKVKPCSFLFPWSKECWENPTCLLPSLPPSLILYWFLENSLKRKPGVLRCSLPSPKLIVSLGREETQKRWSQAASVCEDCPGSLPRLTCMPAPEPCVSYVYY